MPVPPESSTVNDVPDGSRSNWSTSVTSSSKNSPTMPTNKNAPIATTILASGPDLAQVPPEDAALIGVSLPLPTYTPHEHSIRDVNAPRSEELAPALPIYSDVFMRRGRRTEAAGRTETPEGLFIDYYSFPSVPDYEPFAGGSSVTPENTATMHQPEASSNFPCVPTPTIREHNYFTNPLMTADHLQTAYESICTDSIDISYPNPDLMDKIPIQALHALNLHLISDNLTITNIALNAQAGLASWSELNKPHPSDPTKPKIGLQATESVESTKHTSDEAKVKQIQNAKALQDTFIPSTVPEEIQTIIDSYLSGRPLLLVISNKRFLDYWSLRLPKEFGFLMLGYFRILGVEVLTSSNPRFLCRYKHSSSRNLEFTLAIIHRH